MIIVVEFVNQPWSNYHDSINPRYVVCRIKKKIYIYKTYIYMYFLSLNLIRLLEEFPQQTTNLEVNSLTVTETCKVPIVWK